MTNKSKFFIALTVGFLLAYSDFVAITGIHSSTAGWLIFDVPFVFIAGFLCTLLLCYAITFIKDAFKARRLDIENITLGLIGIVMMLASGSYFLTYYIKPGYDFLSVSFTTSSVPQMNHTQINQLILSYPHLSENGGKRIYILNAILQRKDITPEELDKIAKIKDPALFSKDYPTFGFYSVLGFIDSNEKRFSVMRFIAQNPNTSSATLTYLSTLGDSGVLSDVARNQNTPKDLLTSIYEKSESGEISHSIQSDLALNSSTPKDVLTSIYEKSKSGEVSFGIQYNLALNRSTPIYILMELCNSDEEITRREVKYTLKSLGKSCPKNS